MNRQFGALSGIAILLIVLNHSISMGLVPPQELEIPAISAWERDLLSVLQALGAFAVPIFLFISGSFIAYAARGDPPKISTKFLTTSLKHILLPYLFWSVIFYVLIYFHYSQSYSVLGYLKNLLVGYPYHFVPLLAFYYFISPLLVRIGKRYGAMLVIAIGLYQLVLLNITNPGILGFRTPDWSGILAPPVLRNTLADWAIYLPLGMVYGLHTTIILSVINKLRWFIVIFTFAFFFLALLDGIFHVINMPLSRYISVIAFISLIPTIKRDNIPFVRQLEKIGRRSYGIYLTHLILIDISLIIIQTIAWQLYNVPLIVPLLLFSLGIIFPVGLMELASKLPTKRYYRYVFG